MRRFGIISFLLMMHNMFEDLNNDPYGKEPYKKKKKYFSFKQLKKIKV